MAKKSIFKFRLAQVIFAVILTLIPNKFIFCASGELKFSAVLEKTEYTPDEQINVSLVLKNISHNPVLVNKRFYVSAEESARNQREVYFIITSPSGVKLSCKNFYETGYPKTEYFQLLQPKEQVKSEYPRNLRGFFEIKDPGVYRLTAVYQNTYGAEIGLDTFKEKLIADPVTFTIIDHKK